MTLWGTKGLLAFSSHISEWRASYFLCAPQLSSLSATCSQLSQLNVLLLLFCPFTQEVILITLNMETPWARKGLSPQVHFLSGAVGVCTPLIFLCVMFPLSSYFHAAFPLGFPSMLRANDMLMCSIGIICGSFWEKVPECVREVIGQWEVSMAMLPCLANMWRKFMLR